MSPRKRLLFVDDEASIRLTLPPILRESGFEVRTAATVAEALGEISGSHFDVLLSDLNISEAGDGFRVVKAMRHSQPRCVNLILTGYPGSETATVALQHQVDDFVIKPADVDGLIASIQEKLASREKE